MNPVQVFSSVIGILGVFLGLIMVAADVVKTDEHKPNVQYNTRYRDDVTCICHVHFGNRSLLWRHIAHEWVDAHFNCWCGHAKREHTGQAGPNSIGQFFHGQCVAGSSVIGPYRVGGCTCGGFRRHWRTLGRRTSIYG